MTRYERGRSGESLAAEFLCERGLKILDRNIRYPLGEIDLVALDGKTLVFVEVRSRSCKTHGLPQESVTRSKQKRLTRLAQWYLKQHRLEQHSARFDVIAIIWEKNDASVEWIPNAFNAIYQ